MLASRPTSVRTLIAELSAWNLGNAAVAAGTLTGLTRLVDLGGTLLVVALALVGVTMRGARRGPGPVRRWVLPAFQALVLILLVSIPLGLWLARAA